MSAEEKTGQSDAVLMARALDLARDHLGLVWPNPSVGCVILKDGEIISEAATGVGGRPHAEALAIENCKESVEGSTIFVSLEPCCHWGKTPPCTQAIIGAKAKKVVIAVLDSDPRMRGEGMRQLREAGVEVELGLCEKEATQLNEGFFHRITYGRPFVTVLGSDANMESHLADQDAVVSTRGSGLFVSFEYHRRRRSDFHTTDWFLSASEVDQELFASLGGTELMILSEHNDATSVDIEAAMMALGHRGLTRIAVDEADPLADALRRANLIQARLG